MEESCLEVQNGKAIIRIEGTAVVDNIAKLHLIFQEALESQLPVMLDLERITEIDSSFIQLVRSLCYTLNRGGHPSLQLLQDTLPDVLSDLIRRIGFNFNTLCTKVDNVECFCKKIVNTAHFRQETPR